MPQQPWAEAGVGIGFRSPKKPSCFQHQHASSNTCCSSACPPTCLPPGCDQHAGPHLPGPGHAPAQPVAQPHVRILWGAACLPAGTGMQLFPVDASVPATADFLVGPSPAPMPTVRAHPLCRRDVCWEESGKRIYPCIAQDLGERGGLLPSAMRSRHAHVQSMDGGCGRQPTAAVVHGAGTWMLAHICRLHNTTPAPPSTLPHNPAHECRRGRHACTVRPPCGQVDGVLQRKPADAGAVRERDCQGALYGRGPAGAREGRRRE